MKALVICSGESRKLHSRFSPCNQKQYHTHCHTHSLRLGINYTVNQCELLSNTMATGKEIYALINCFSKEREIFGRVNDSIETGNEEDLKECSDDR